MSRIPAAEWQAAKNRQTTDERDKIARWLGVDPAHPHAWYAVLPFVRMDTDDGARCAAVLPPALPLAFGGPVAVHDDADVVLLDGKGGATLHRDPGSMLVGTLTEGALYTNALTFARDWARFRLMFLERLRVARETHHIDLHEDRYGAAPGTLLIGAASKVREWPVGVAFTTPDAATAEVVNIAIWRTAKLARASVAAPHLKAVG
jgi:hypothetical protein